MDDAQLPLSRRAIALRVLPAAIAVALLLVGSWRRGADEPTRCAQRVAPAHGADRPLAAAGRGSCPADIADGGRRRP